MLCCCFLFDVGKFFLVVFYVKIEIGRIEVVNTNETVLTTRAVALAVRMESNTIDGTEVITYASKLFFEDQVEETSLEFA